MDGGSLESPSHPDLWVLWVGSHPIPDRPPWFPSKKEMPPPLTEQSLPAYAPAPAVGRWGLRGLEVGLAGSPAVVLSDIHHPRPTYNLLPLPRVGIERGIGISAPNAQSAECQKKNILVIVAAGWSFTA